MSRTDMIDAATRGFTTQFGVAPAVVSYAPGRVNLLGEHTDYNGGLVLPMPLGLGAAIAFDLEGAPGHLEAASASFDGVKTRSFDDAARDHWSDYILGSLQAFWHDAFPDIGLRVMVTADLPAGSGLSSSAALEVATLRGACDLFQRPMDAVALAKLARHVENVYVGVPCGIMDQFSVSVGTPGKALFLDTRNLETRQAPLPTTHRLVVVHSGVTHKLSDDGYRQRVAECADACKALHIDMLSDFGPDDLPQINALPRPLDGRARHIITENARVRAAIAALDAGDTVRFAGLMNESHASQRDDYAVSVPQVDALVDGARAAGAEGARLTGGGFGGSIVALVASGQVDAFCATIDAQFADARILAVT